MYDVVLFGGTNEGHKIADFLKEKNISHIVCVATEYGAKLLNNENVKIGRMTTEEMKEFFTECGARVVVDATHPYADKVTKNIKSACCCKYIRVSREDIAAAGRHFSDISTAAKYLDTVSGNILITTGAKDIAEFSRFADRAYARVLPSEESVRACADAGFRGRHVICMQGPFSKELNSAVMRELDIKYLVTKQSGMSGGFSEKIEAARDTGVECIIIDRPADESGVTLKEAEKLISEWL